MARAIKLNDYQEALRGEQEAAGDLDDGRSGPSGRAELDALSGDLADGEPTTVATAAGHTYSVGGDGTVRDWREVARDRAAESTAAEPTVHRVRSDEDLPEQAYSRLVPSDADFAGRLYRPAPELANLAETLLDRHGFFDQLRDCAIEYKWRRKGGGSKGKHRIGYLKRVSDLLADYCEAQYVIWLAADTARLAAFDDRQVEAALFHQLCHISTDVNGNWIKVPHDFEGFGAEVREYGPWTEDLKIGSQAFTVAVQLGLDLDTAGDDFDDEDDASDDFDTVRDDGSADPDGPSPEDDDLGPLPAAPDDDDLADHDL